MRTAHTTRRVIIIAAVSFQALIFNDVLHASSPCPNGWCPLPDRASEHKEALRMASRRAALKNMLKKQVGKCGPDSNESISAQLNEEMSGLQEQIVLKAKETGMLLQLPGIVMEFMKTRSVRNNWKQFCYDGSRNILSIGRIFMPSKS